ncbi:12889_t:CDS:2, partial [Racocetra persica]
TIIKIKYIKQNETKDAKSISVWAIGLYPVGHEDNEIEVVLYIPHHPNERDPETQAIFRKDEYYSVGGKIVPNNYAGIATSTHLIIGDKTSKSNKCPLKVSLIGSPKEKLNTIENTDDSVLEIIIADYITQEYEFMESIIFVVGQMEIIDNKSKLLNIHQNITKNLKDTPVTQTPPATTSSDIEGKLSVKRRRSEKTNQPINNNYKSETNKTIFTKPGQEEHEKPTKKNKSQKNHIHNQTKTKECPVRSTCNAKNPQYSTVDIESDEE